jgi:Protein of unknown function (DUF4238)
MATSTSSRTAGSSRSVCSAQLGRTARWNRRASRARVRAASQVKTSGKTFAATSKSIAAESDFYWLHEFEKMGHDPLTLEKQLSNLEYNVATITEQWIGWISQMAPKEKVPIPVVNREIVSRYIALQFLRTADRKDLLCAMYELDHPHETLSPERRTELHTTLLWDLKGLAKIEKHIQKAIWIFGRNQTATPFWTSDNPVAFKTANNKMWLKVGFISRGTYVVFPLSPTIVLYCHERTYWKKIAKWDRIVSPIEFTDEMVEHENAGQVFMASRFVVSPNNGFEFAREFAPSIGTDKYASDSWEEGLFDPRSLLRKHKR